jgi:hypothetical protein
VRLAGECDAFGRNPGEVRKYEEPQLAIFSSNGKANIYADLSVEFSLEPTDAIKIGRDFAGWMVGALRTMERLSV